MAFDLTAGNAESSFQSPGGSMVDRSILIQLERSDFASSADATAFYALFTSTDMTKCRFCKGDETTELAFDVFDYSLTTGSEYIHARVLWSGTLTSTGSYTLHIMPALTGNTSYGATDTYGRENAYSSEWEGYWPKGSGINRIDGTSSTTGGSPTLDNGDVFGFTGVEFNAQTDYIDTNIDFTTEDSHTLSLLYNVDLDSYTTSTALGASYFDGQLFLDLFDRIYWRSGDFRLNSGSFSADNETDSFLSLTYEDAVGGRYINNDSDIDLTDSDNGATGSKRFYIGSIESLSAVGIISQVRLLSEQSDDEEDYEYLQESDNSTFIGTMTYNAPSGGGETIAADLLTIETTLQDPTFSAGATFTGVLQNQEINQLDPSFLSGATITAELQSLELTQQQASFLSGVVATQGLQTVEIELLSPTFIAGTGEVILADLLNMAITPLNPVFNLGGEYISAALLTTEINQLQPTFTYGGKIFASLLTVEIGLLDPQFSELGKVNGLLKVAISGKIPNMDIDGAVPTVTTTGKIPTITITGEII